MVCLEAVWKQRLAGRYFGKLSPGPRRLERILDVWPSMEAFVESTARSTKQWRDHEKRGCLNALTLRQYLEVAGGPRKHML